MTAIGAEPVQVTLRTHNSTCKLEATIYILQYFNHLITYLPTIHERSTTVAKRAIAHKYLNHKLILKNLPVHP